MTSTSALPDTIPLVVVGAHLTGMPLNGELLALGATFIKATRTTPSYKLYALAGTVPPKPGLLRVADGGASIDVEVWALTPAAFGTFVSRIPSPLGIGTLQLDDGGTAKGFLVESVAVDGARDISDFGGWRSFIVSLEQLSAAG
jgi:allophanate hydrolase